jgi:hypothetical protein
MYGAIMNDATDVKGIKTGPFWGWYAAMGAFLILAISYWCPSFSTYHTKHTPYFPGF